MKTPASGIHVYPHLPRCVRPQTSGREPRLVDMTPLEPFVIDESLQGQAMIVRIFAAIDYVVRSHDHQVASPALLTQSDTDFARLCAELPDAPVDLATSVSASAAITRVSLVAVHQQLATPGSHVVPIAIHARAALVASGRILYCLGPSSAEQRHRHAQRVLLQEASSYLRALKSAHAYAVMQKVVPTEGTVDQVKAQVRDLERSITRLQGERDMLDEMASVVGALLCELGPEGEDLEVVRQAHQEHVMWLFHFYSGFAHGYGWPTLCPPGELVADLVVITGVAALAMQVLEERTQQ